MRVAISCRNSDRGRLRRAGNTSGFESGKSITPGSMGGMSGGAPGPRTGNSSGAFGGSSCGCAGASGSRTGEEYRAADCPAGFLRRFGRLTGPCGRHFLRIAFGRLRHHSPASLRIMTGIVQTGIVHSLLLAIPVSVQTLKPPPRLGPAIIARPWHVPARITSNEDLTRRDIDRRSGTPHSRRLMRPPSEMFMPLAYWCILIAALMPLAGRGMPRLACGPTISIRVKRSTTCRR